MEAPLKNAVLLAFAIIGALAVLGILGAAVLHGGMMSACQGMMSMAR